MMTATVMMMKIYDDDGDDNYNDNHGDGDEKD